MELHVRSRTYMRTTKQLEHGFFAHYRIYTYELLVELLKIEHEAHR